MAVDFQSGPRMTELITCVTNAWPFETRLGGCSLTWLFGVTHETAGSVPSRAAVKNLEIEVTFRTWWSRRTVSNHGSGFQIPGVAACRCFAEQNIAPSSQSGSPPAKT